MAGRNNLGREVDGVTVFDEPVLGEENYVSPPPPVFDGPNGLPTGWTRIEFSFSGRRVKGAMSEKAAVMPVPGGWGLCPVKGNSMLTRRVLTRQVVSGVVLDDMNSAIVAAEIMWPS